MKKYKIQDREAGNVIEENLTFEQAQEMVLAFVKADKKEGNYTPEFYEIKEMETNTNITKGKWKYFQYMNEFSIYSCEDKKGVCKIPYGQSKSKSLSEKEAEINAVLIASLPDIMRENERLNKTVNDLLETGSSKLSIKQRQELESENEELKKGIKYAEKIAFDTSKQNADLMVKCETYKKDYDSMVAEVVKLSGEKSELLEALSNLIKVSEESTKDIVAFENADILDNCIDKAKAVITK